MATDQLTPKQLRILQFLAKAEHWVSRKEMEEETGRKGFSNALGAASRRVQPSSLEGLGLVDRRALDKPFVYRITEAGRKQLLDDATTQPLPRIDVEATDLDDEQLENAIKSSALYFPETVATGTTIALTRQRRGQEALRRLTIRNYGGRCAVCDVADERLLCASHIIPWAWREETRGYLSNVICLCSFHDVLFELGYWSLDNHLRPVIRASTTSATLRALLAKSLSFRTPRSYAADLSFVQEHRARHGVA
jgi:hypothetical protein